MMRLPKYAIIAICLVAAGVCFTPFYSVVFVGLLAFASIRRPFASAFFETYLSRFVLNFLVLSGLLMITGLYAWTAGIPFLPIYAAFAFAGYYYLTTGRIESERNLYSHVIANRKDALAITLAMLAILLVSLSSFLPQPTVAAFIQRMTLGYDNTAHYSLIQTTYETNGFAYGPFDEVRDQTITPLNNYPQGWHFANAMMLKGFGVDFFSANSVAKSIVAYNLVVFFWYFITVYLFTRASLAILDSVRQPIKRRSFGFVLSFALANILFQLMVFWGSLNLGFASFLPSMAYLIFLAWIVLGLKQSSDHAIHKIFLILLTASATAEVWLLPVPAVGLTIALSLLPFANRTTWKWIKSHRRIAAAYATAAVLILAPCLIQAYIFVAYAEKGSGDLLNTDGGIFAISNMLATILVIFTVAVITAYRPLDAGLRDSFVISVLPIFLMTFGVFFFQLITAEKTTYYLIKMLGLGICLLGIYFVPLFATTLSRIRFQQTPSLLLATLSAGVIGGLVVTTGQTTVEFNSFLQRNSKIEYETAAKISDLAEDGTIFRQRIVVLRDKTHDEDSDGTYFANRLAHTYGYGACEAKITLLQDTPMSKRIQQLKRCSQRSPITVITSNKTYDILSKLDQPNITVVNVP